MDKTLVIYLAIYTLPLAAIMATSAPDLELSPRVQFSGYRMPAHAVPVFLWLSLANLVIYGFLTLAIELQPLLITLAWECIYGVFARWVGPWLHD